MCREGTGRGILFSMYFNCLILSGVRNYLGRIRCRCAGNLNDTHCAVQPLQWGSVAT